MPILSTTSATLSPLDRERHISVPEAAKFKNISPDTFKRHYGHLIRKTSPRRNTVKVGDLLKTDEQPKHNIKIRGEIEQSVG
jgi:hypothetical protein